MLAALPCISDGALSLDGGIIRTTGTFSLGSRLESQNVPVICLISSKLRQLSLIIATETFHLLLPTYVFV